jgi:hypothetical protein
MTGRDIMTWREVSAVMFLCTAIYLLPIPASENFTEHAMSIQNGTHPSPPINPVVDVLEELESELRNIAEVFETRLLRLKHDGERAFGGEADDADVTASTLEPQFSILPVPKDEINREGATGDTPVVIGRSKEEIVDALNRVGEGAEPIPSKSMQSEETVGSHSQKVSVEASQSTLIPVADHVEL